MWTLIEPSMPGRERVLVLFKFPSRWNSHVLTKLNVRYNLVCSNISELLGTGGSESLIAHTRQLCQNYPFDYIVCDPEFYYLVSPYLIRELNKVRPTGIMIFDHEIEGNNLRLVGEATFVLAAAPQVCSYVQSIGGRAAFFPLESFDLYQVDEVPAKFDVFFFGHIAKDDRPLYVDALKRSRLSLDIHSIDMPQLSYAQLATRIKGAKVTVNLSKLVNFYVPNVRLVQGSGDDPQFVYGLKGRIQEVAFCKRLCVSEFTPPLGMLRLAEAVPQFRTPAEMILLLEHIICGGRLDEFTVQFLDRVLGVYSSEAVMDGVVKMLGECGRGLPAVNATYKSAELSVYLEAVRNSYGQNASLISKETACLLTLLGTG